MAVRRGDRTADRFDSRPASRALDDTRRTPRRTRGAASRRLWRVHAVSPARLRHRGLRQHLDQPIDTAELAAQPDRTNSRDPRYCGIIRGPGIRHTWRRHARALRSPRRLVTTGIYAYIRNRMQLSAVMLLLLLGAALQHLRLAIAGVMAHIYVADSCGMCSQVGRWLQQHGASGLAILPAETHSSPALTRITYEPADGARTASGVEAWHARSNTCTSAGRSPAACCDCRSSALPCSFSSTHLAANHAPFATVT